jgi:hypothetical protein
VADYYALLSCTVRTAQRAYLADHFHDCPCVVAVVVGGTGIPDSRVVTEVPHVNQIDLNNALEHGHGLRFLVATGVIHNGEHQASLPGCENRLDYRRQEVGGRDQIDVGRTPLLEGQHHLHKIFQARGVTVAQLAYREVLAVDACHAAVSEEYGARTSPAGNGRFLTCVKTEAGNLQIRPGLTEAELTPGPGNSALSGAEHAAVQLRSEEVQSLVHVAAHPEIVGCPYLCPSDIRPPVPPNQYTVVAWPLLWGRMCPVWLRCVGMRSVVTPVTTSVIGAVSTFYSLLKHDIRCSAEGTPRPCTRSTCSVATAVGTNVPGGVGVGSVDRCTDGDVVCEPESLVLVVADSVSEPESSGLETETAGEYVTAVVCRMPKITESNVKCWNQGDVQSDTVLGLIVNDRQCEFSGCVTDKSD